jgi:alkylation response protein AidB-like acyl-CoA dehydrogenase
VSAHSLASTLEPSAHHAELRETLRAYLERHAPHAVVSEHDTASRYPREIVDGLAELGILGATVPEEYGGSAADAISVAIISEELQRAGSCIASAITPTLTFCAPGIAEHGSAEQKARLLPAIAAGELRLAIGLTEPDAASDLSKVAMRAIPDGDGFRVDGVKVWCTGALEAGYVLALVRTDPQARGYEGLSMLLVPTDAEGVTVRKIPKLAGQATASCEVFADGVFVPGENLVGTLHEGRQILWSLLDSERVFVAANCVGIAQGAYDYALQYARERRQFGRPIIEHQAIGHRLVDMAAEVAQARLLAYTAAGKADRGVPYSLDAALAKVACSEAATRVVLTAMEVLGAYSYATEYPIERYYREVKLFEIAGGTNQVLRTAIAKRLAAGAS